MEILEQYQSYKSRRITLWEDPVEADNGYLWTAQFIILDKDRLANFPEYIKINELIEQHLNNRGFFQREPEPYLWSDRWDRMSHDELFGLAIIHWTVNHGEYFFRYFKKYSWTYNERERHRIWHHWLFYWSNVEDFFKLIKTGIKYGAHKETDEVVESNMFLKLLASRLSWRDRYVITMAYKGRCYNPFYHWGFFFRTMLTAFGLRKTHSSRLLAMFKTKWLRDEFKSKRLTAWLLRKILRIRMGKDYIEQMKSFYPTNNNPIRANLNELV